MNSHKSVHRISLRSKKQVSNKPNPSEIKIHYFNGLTGVLNSKQQHNEQKQVQNNNNLKKQQHILNRKISNHLYWFNKHHPTSFFLSSQRLWNYCDYKCLYLQKYNPNKDFVVIVLGGFLKQDFSVCYVKNGQDYTLWKQITSNKFYQENCGQDYKDWIKESQFEIKGIYGIGIGTPLDEDKIYK